MLLNEILYEVKAVWVDEEGNILTEAAARHFKRSGGRIKRQFICTSGQKKGKIVADRFTCTKRKDPKKKRHGKKTSRRLKGIRKLKTKISKRKQQSKQVTRMNKRLKGIQSLGS